MASGKRREMDWTTAWSAMVPVYGLAILFAAVHPLFAVPIWVIFLVYAFKVLGGARAADDPWRGRGSPRPYLFTFVASLVVQWTSVAALSPDAGSSLVVSALVGTVVALSLAAYFVAASAPPRVRDERLWLRAGVAAGIASALLLPAAEFGSYGSTPQESLVVLLLRLALSVGSLAGFLLASRAVGRRVPAVAHKVPHR